MAHAKTAKDAKTSCRSRSLCQMKHSTSDQGLPAHALAPLPFSFLDGAKPRAPWFVNNVLAPSAVFARALLLPGPRSSAYATCPALGLPGRCVSPERPVRMPPNKGLLTDGWVRCAHPPAAEAKALGGQPGPHRAVNHNWPGRGLARPAVTPRRARRASARAGPCRRATCGRAGASPGGAPSSAPRPAGGTRPGRSRR